MPHPLRWYLPDVVYEVTTRTIQERFLLRPSREARELVLGVIGRALAFYSSVRIYAFVFLSNHYHMLVSAADGAELAQFLGYVNGNISRELGRLHGWRGTLWGRRARPIPILDEAAQIERLRYVLANGVKEGLVASPREWPGASCVPALLGDMSLTGVWIDRDGLRRARTADPKASAAPFTSNPVVTLSPLPVWSELPADERRRKHEEIVLEIEQEATASGRRFLGAAAVMAQDPHDAPVASARRVAPVCHTTSPGLRDAFRQAYAAFVAAFRAASQSVAASVRSLSTVFPPGSFPRPPSFHPSSPGFVARLAVDVMLRPNLGRGTPYLGSVFPGG